MTLAKELLKVSIGLLLAFGLVDLAKFFIIATSVAYVLSYLVTPLALTAVAAAAMFIIATSYATAFLAWRILKEPETVRIGEIVATSQVALINTFTSLILLDFLLAIANALTTLSLYMYAAERVKRRKAAPRPPDATPLHTDAQ